MCHLYEPNKSYIVNDTMLVCSFSVQFTASLVRVSEFLFDAQRYLFSNIMLVSSFFLISMMKLQNPVLQNRAFNNAAITSPVYLPFISFMITCPCI